MTRKIHSKIRTVLLCDGYSIWGHSFKRGKIAWVVELISYETNRDEVSVRSSIYQGKGCEPELFTTKKQAEMAISKILKDVSGHKLIGYSIKKITLVEFDDE